MIGAPFDAQISLARKCELFAVPVAAIEDGAVLVQVWSPAAGGPVHVRAVPPRGMDLDRLKELAHEGWLAAAPEERRGWRRLKVLRPV